MPKKFKGRIFLYYNPFSGSGVFKENLDHIIERCQAAGYVVMPMRAADDFTIHEVMERLDPSEFDRLIVAGGDGTLNRCIDAMVKNDIDIPIGILPSGTANDFAFYFELKNDLEEALDVALGDKTTKADLGFVNGRCFVNVCAMGNMVDVSQKTDPTLKNALGPLAYYLKAASELPQVHAIPIKMTTQTEVIEEEIYFMTIMNGESAGGFRKLSPKSSMSDGKLDVVAFKKMPIVEFGPLLFEVISGTHPKNKNVLYFQTETLRVESIEDIPTDFDGEKGEKLPLDFSVLNGRLRVFVSAETWHYDD
ncbi:MAG: YegS/Rv2252/BmrU family lipid kinase [Bacillota bacterium]|nr:YegS/Rv2252/BmrU family lipid kinase [Bacillota bacterium]